MGGAPMKSEDFYGPVEFQDVLTSTKVRHDVKWVIRRAVGTSGVSDADCLLPNSYEIPQLVGKLVWVTNNGNPAGIPGEYLAGVYGTFRVKYRTKAGALVDLAGVPYEQTAVFGLRTDGSWMLVKRFNNLEFTAPVSPVGTTYRVDITADVNNVVIDDEIRQQGWDGVEDVFVDVFVRNGVTIGSLDTSRPALKATLTGQNSRVFLTVEPGGSIVGAGGAGGDGGLGSTVLIRGQDGQDGGPALEARTLISIVNGGTIGGGGGGGAGGDGSTGGDGSGGGGGAGVVSGPGGNRGNPAAQPGGPTTGGAGGIPLGTGTLSFGGDGGDLGQPGDPSSLGVASPGAAGDWGQWLSFGLPAGQQPQLYATPTQQYLGPGNGNLT